MMRYLFFIVIFSLLFLYRCSVADINGFWVYTKNKITTYQENNLKERYGYPVKNNAKLEEWELEIKEYEKFIEEKIKVADKTGKLYRKIGESYAYSYQYKLCTKNLEQAINYNEINADVFYLLGLCYGNLAQRNNWDFTYTKKSEEAFLKVLNLDPKYQKVKLELGLIYLNGFGKNNKYRVLDEYITVTQKDYVKKALSLLEESLQENNYILKTYFALATAYQILDNIPAAINITEESLKVMEKKDPKNYKKNKEYEIAQLNLLTLRSTKK